MFRLTSFLKRAPAIDRATFVSGWTGALSERIIAHPRFVRSVRAYVANLPFATVPDAFLWIAADEFDGVAELWFDDLPAAIATANALAADPDIARIAATLIDAAGSVSWIGHVVEDLDGPGVAVKRIVAGQARPGMPIEEAQDYWLHEHGAFFQGYPAFMAYMRRYRPIYGISTPALRLASHKLMAMCADVGFESLQDLSDAYREPTHAADMMTDLVKFGAAGGAITFTAETVRVLAGQDRG